MSAHPSSNPSTDDTSSSALYMSRAHSRRNAKSVPTQPRYNKYSSTELSSDSIPKGLVHADAGGIASVICKANGGKGHKG